MSTRTLARLKRDLKRYGIKHEQVAKAARHRVHRTMVVHVLAGRVKSQNVLDAAERLLAVARAAAERREQVVA